MATIIGRRCLQLEATPEGAPQFQPKPQNISNMGATSQNSGSASASSAKRPFPSFYNSKKEGVTPGAASS
jgi:hypothetical protein